MLLALAVVACSDTVNDTVHPDSSLVRNTSGDNAGRTSASNTASKNTVQSSFADYLKLNRVDEDDEQAKRALQDLFNEQLALSKAISQQGQLDFALLNSEVEEFRRERMIKHYFKHFLKNAVTDETVQQHYRDNPEAFERQKIRIAHILLRQDSRPKRSGHSETALQNQLNRAKDIRNQLIQGLSFEKAAKRFSFDTGSKNKAGELGWVYHDKMPNAFVDAVFGLKAGEVSQPFVTDFGVQIVKVLEGPVKELPSFPFVKHKIRQTLEEKARQAEMQRLLALATNIN